MNVSGAKDAVKRHELWSAMQILLGLVVLGVLLIMLFAGHYWSWSRFSSVASTAVMVGGAALTFGVLIGFVFAVPRTLQSDQVGKDSSTSTRTEHFQTNTNLEQISDWLTKIMVGVGLTQLPSILRWLDNFGTRVGPAFGDSGNTGVFAISILLYFLVCGFLIGYLWTRALFADAIGASELYGRVNRLEQENAALALVSRQLTLAAEPANPSTLAAALRTASPDIRVQAFNLASKVRQENWEAGGNKELLERTVAIWQALIDSDPDGKYFRNHAELGFTLKDKASPDWTRAIQELTKAIELRDSRGGSDASNYVYPEFARAICRIKLDELTNGNGPSAPTTKEQIKADIEKARSIPNIRSKVDASPEITTWLARNP